MSHVDWRALIEQRGTSCLTPPVITAVITLTCNYAIITHPKKLYLVISHLYNCSPKHKWRHGNAGQETGTESPDLSVTERPWGRRVETRDFSSAAWPAPASPSSFLLPPSSIIDTTTSQLDPHHSILQCNQLTPSARRRRARVLQLPVEKASGEVERVGGVPGRNHMSRPPQCALVRSAWSSSRWYGFSR